MTFVIVLFFLIGWWLGYAFGRQAWTELYKYTLVKVLLDGLIRRNVQ